MSSIDFVNMVTQVDAFTMAFQLVQQKSEV